MAVIGCYTVDLYCDRDGTSYGESCRYRRADYTGGAQAQYTGHTERDCLTDARSDGWKFYQSATIAICPACSADGYKPRRM